MIDRLREPWTDHRAERMLGAVAVFLCLLVVLIIVAVFLRALPTLQANAGVGWLLPGGPDVDRDLARQVNTGANVTDADYKLSLIHI